MTVDYNPKLVGDKGTPKIVGGLSGQQMDMQACEGMK
jgi:hypothetical protein